MKYPTHLIKLIETLKKLPGVGNKSAERYAFEMLSWPAFQLEDMAEAIGSTKKNLRHCQVCGCLGDQHECHFCSQERLQNKSLCIIATPREVFAIEETREFKGTYHVLGALLSPMEGKGPEFLAIDKLRSRLQDCKIEDVIIALDSTLEGDATALYLKSALSDLPLKITRLAFGLPMGSSLDYVDGGTLARAFSARNPY